jgi:arylsulfatase A-like enzyme
VQSVRSWVAQLHEQPASVQSRVLREVGRGRQLTSPELEFLLARYDQEIRHLDAEIGRLLDGASELLDRSLLVFTADHGEEFLDHGRMLHAHSLYDELIEVPLLLRFPGRLQQGTVISSPVRLLDLGPTVLSLLGREPIGLGQGLALDRISVPRSESQLGTSLLATRDRGWKLISPLALGLPRFDSAAPRDLVRLWARVISRVGEELYDLERDPRESRNLLARPSVETPYPDLAQPRGERTLDAQTRRQLESLGYAD